MKRKYTIQAILGVLGVARATYYRWKNKMPEQIPPIVKAIQELCIQTKYRYGHRKIKALLKKEYNLVLNRNTVQRIMQKYNLQCRVKRKRKWKSQGESEVVAPNRLNRNFMAMHPNEKWVTDITYIQFGPRTLYLSTILDLYNNEVVAYKLYSHQQVPLVLDMLKEALEVRGYPQGVLIHSDQGSVYASYAYQKFIQKSNLVSSMSRRGNCWDNAVIESFHSHVKTEEFSYDSFNSMSETSVINRIDAYLNHYNEERIQEKLGYLSPKEYGKRAA